MIKLSKSERQAAAQQEDRSIRAYYHAKAEGKPPHVKARLNAQMRQTLKAAKKTKTKAFSRLTPVSNT